MQEVNGTSIPAFRYEKMVASKALKKAPASAEGVQFGTLPYRIAEDGSLRLLLVTSRETRRWVVPKGWPMKGKKPYEAAATEAFEEAGVGGRPARRPIGSYQYWKRLEDCFRLCRVEVYPLAVEQVEETWPEQHERTREWFDAETAATLVDEPGLVALIEAFRREAAPPSPKEKRQR